MQKDVELLDSSVRNCIHKLFGTQKGAFTFVTVYCDVAILLLNNERKNVKK